MNIETFIKGWTLLFVAVLGVVILSALPGCAAIVRCEFDHHNCEIH